MSRYGPKPRPVLDRFWEHVDQTGDCWLWTGRVISGNGYGEFRIAKIGNKWVGVRAHRFSYEIANGPIPSGAILMHSCDTPLCVNPAHLRPGSARENRGDAADKGRRANCLEERMRAKTHCARGHEFSDENTRVDRRGWRVCRQCKRERALRATYEGLR